jgi:hypothetical protein
MGAWTTGPRTANWVENPTVGDGTTPNGGSPPALDYEFDPIDEQGYTRADWLESNPSRIEIDDSQTATIGGGKFRITLQHLKFGRFDPIIHPGMRGLAHLHEFKGNIAVNENSTWPSLRQTPGSNNVGGPLNSSAYWAPALLFLDPVTGLYLPVKSLYSALYYNLQSEADPAKVFRLIRGIEIIGGVDPADRFNTARLAELPSFMTKETWSGTPGVSTMSGSNRYNGWLGWHIFTSGGVEIPPHASSDADRTSAGAPRQLVNSDGSDPWNGAAEDPTNIMVAIIMQPTVWDGHNLTSPNGRDHLRYWGNKTGFGAQMDRIGPDGWWYLPNVENKDFFPNGRNGISGHAWRQRLWFSSDLFDMSGNPWSTPHPNGSTPHFDLIPNWDDQVLTGTNGWQQQCPGISINGVAGNAGECNSGTINATQNLKGGARPAGYTDAMSPNPIISVSDTAPAATKDGCGIPVLNSRIPTALSTC